MNTTTTITLNDRFSMMKHSNGVKQNTQPRGRSRSRSRSRGRDLRGGRGSRGRPQQMINVPASRRNLRLLDHLEKQHKMRMALKLKNKSITRTRGRGKAQNIRTALNRVGARKPANARRNLQRSNSLTTFIPLNDAPGRVQLRGRSRSRSRSRNQVQRTGSITDRLGVRQPRRGRMRRGQANGNGVQQPQRSRSRPRSRVRLNRNNFNNGNGNNQPRSNSRARSNSRPRPNSRIRSNSVNARLGQNNNNHGPNQIRRRRRIAASKNQLNRPLAGRIAKRNPKNPVGNPRIQRNANMRKAGQALGVNARRGRPIKRGAGGKFAGQAQARGRARNRGPNNQAGQGNSRRGRSRTRRGANTNRGGAGGKAQVSKEALDRQLDDYMSKGSA